MAEWISGTRPAWASRWAVVPLLLLASMFVTVWLDRVTLLGMAAHQWIVSDPVAPADAVVVLGGYREERAIAASEYYHKGLVSRVLVSNGRQSKEQKLGLAPSEGALTRELLLRLGIPENAVETLGPTLQNTYEEAIALREWASRSHARNVLVPTEALSARRVRWIMRRELAATGTRVAVPALDLPENGGRGRWKDDGAFVAFQNEVIKYAYYRLKY
jgi:uncharacterized SAM-binding protein YcdF (DUF218 family)